MPRRAVSKTIVYLLPNLCHCPYISLRNCLENWCTLYETVRLDVRLENETVWLNRHQMAQLFGRDIKTIAQGILFRRWANTVLKEYLLRGYSVNARLNQLEDKMDRRLSK